MSGSIRRLLVLGLALLTVPAAAQDRIDAVVTAYMARENIPGVSLVVLRRDRVALSKAWGLADRASGAPMRVDAVQPVYSVSKQVTAALILRLVAQGRIELDAPVGRYLPRWFADEPDLLVRHVLSNTSGIPDFVSIDEARALDRAPAGTGSLESSVALIDRLPRRFAPGARYAYSSGNFTLLALLAERVGGGDTFGEMERRLLFEPLGLAIAECASLDRSLISPGHSPDGSPFALPPNLVPNYSGNGGLCASAEALARWTRALGAGRVVRPPLLDWMRQSRRVAAGYRPPYGFGLQTALVAGRPALSHAGAGDGWGAWAAYFPAEEMSVVLLVNRGWFWATDLAVPIVRVLLDLPPPEPLRRAALTGIERRDLTGTFEDGQFEITLRAEGDRLFLSNAAFGDPIILWRQPGGRFISPMRPDTFALRLVRGRPQFDWMGARAYLVRRAPQPASPAR